MPDVPRPRLVRSTSDPLGFYVRVGHNDHHFLAGAVASGRRRFTGVVVEAHRVKRHRELLDLVEGARLETVLDPCTQALAMPGGYSNSKGALPWGLGHRHRLRDFESAALLERVTSIATFAVRHRFSELISPTHYIESDEDPWLSIDIEATRATRKQLDRSGGKYIGLIYLLTIPYAALRNPSVRSRIVEKLRNLSIDALWLRVDPFGDNSTGAAVRNYLEAQADFHRLGVPIVADSTGGLVGLALLSTSAIAGLCHGITQRERFDGSSWKNSAKGDGFTLPHRVYLPTLDLFLKPETARHLFENSVRLRDHFGCKDPACCARGVADMIGSPGMHFLNQRTMQLEWLGPIPASLRPTQFLDRFVRPTADAVVRFASSQSLDPEMRARVVRHRKRLDLLRVALEDLVSSARLATTSMAAETRASREHRMSR